MARLSGSFLIRLWRTGRTQRIEIQHIQSGEKELVTSVAEAVDWINDRAGNAALMPGRDRHAPDQKVDLEGEDSTAGCPTE